MRAIYPGVFDPITLGHLDIIERAVGIFSDLEVVVGENLQKQYLFSAQERVELVKQTLVEKNLKVKVSSFQGLIVNYLKEKKAVVMIRGLRAVTDFEYELQIASINQKLYSQAETFFLTARDRFTYLSSSLVKELALLHSPINQFVPSAVEKALKQKFSN